MKKRRVPNSALLIIGLPLIVLSLACCVWVRREQRQHRLDRQLITALLKSDTDQARVLVEAGADPNTHAKLVPAPSLASLIKQFLHRSPPRIDISPTASSLACGARYAYVNENNSLAVFDPSLLDPRLTQAMLLHGADIHAKDRYGVLALHRIVLSTLHASPAEYARNKEIITQLLAHGADPDTVDNAFPGTYGVTAMQTESGAATFDAVPHPDLLALLRKYSKHP